MDLLNENEMKNLFVSTLWRVRHVEYRTAHQIQNWYHPNDSRYWKEWIYQYSYKELTLNKICICLYFYYMKYSL